jgi:cyclic pyranopterin monophosphate synthase
MAAKRTHELIPLCHPLAITKVSVELTPSQLPCGIAVEATVKVSGPTGVEMEALTAVSVACLTLYDMLKAVERGMTISDIKLIAKEGGQSGRWTLDGAQDGTHDITHDNTGPGQQPRLQS